MKLAMAHRAGWPFSGLLIVATVLLIGYYGQIDYTAPAYAGIDLAHYREIAAQAPALPVGVQQPFAFRLLGPYLAGLLPLPDATAFYLLTVITALALALLLYGYLRRCWQIDPLIALVTVLLFVCNRHLFGFNVWDFFQINDIMTQLALVGAFWSLNVGRWWALAISLLVGVLARETSLLVAPVALVYLSERKRLASEWRSLALALLPALLVFAWVRWRVEPSGGLSLMQAFGRYAAKVAEPEALFRLFINSFIPFTFLPLLFFRTTAGFFRQNRYLLLFLALVVVGSLFGSNNERLMAPAFIVFYPLIGVIVQTYWRSQPVFVGLFLLAALAGSLNHQWTRFPLPNRQITLILSLAALAATTLVVLPTAWRSARLRSPSPAITETSSTGPHEPR